MNGSVSVCECGHDSTHHNWIDSDYVFCMFEDLRGRVCGCLGFVEDEDETFYRMACAAEGTAEIDAAPADTTEGTG